MNVSELIEKLQTVPSQAEVLIGGDTSWQEGIDCAVELDSRTYSVETITTGIDGNGKVFVAVGGRMREMVRVPRQTDGFVTN